MVLKTAKLPYPSFRGSAGYVDNIRVPVTDMEKAIHFSGEVLGLERNPNSPDEDWVEYETGNVTLAVMTPHSHDYEFTPLPPGTIALRVADVYEPTDVPAR